MARLYFHASFFAPIRLLIVFAIGAAVALVRFITSTVPAVFAHLFLPRFGVTMFKKPAPLKPIYRESWLSNGLSLGAT